MNLILGGDPGLLAGAGAGAGAGGSSSAGGHGGANPPGSIRVS